MLLTNIWLAGNKLAFFLLQAAEQAGGETAGATEDFSLWGMIQKMEWPAITVAIILAVMSMYSIAVMVERWLTFNAAKKPVATVRAKGCSSAQGEPYRRGDRHL
jgi:hypothetical protein